MNKARNDYLRRTRQTYAMILTDTLNKLATLENARAYEQETDQLVFCQNLLEGADIRASLTTDEGERNCLRLERKLLKLLKG